MELRDIMTSDVASVQRSTPVQDAAKLMKDHNVGAIPVCDGDRVVGIITDRDIVLRDVADGDKNIKCGDIMSSQLVSGTPEMDAGEAADIMADNQIRRLPVVDNGRLVGIVSLGDVAVEPKLVDEAKDALNDISKP